MPTQQRHVDQAEKNERISKALASPSSMPERFTDWEVTTLFYSALHYVDAFLDSTSGIHPMDHKARNFWVSKANGLSTVAIRYLNLYQRSLDARYNLVSIPEAEVDRIETDDFHPVKSHIRTLLSLPDNTV